MRFTLDSKNQTAAVFSILVILLVASVGGYTVLGPGKDAPETTNTAESRFVGVLDGYNASNFSRTRRLIENARVPSSGYTELRPDKPTVYATYYYLRTARIAGIGTGNENATRTWLQDVLENDFNSPGLTTLSNGSFRSLRDYRDAVVALSLLNATPRNTSDTVADIREFRTPNGSYCFTVNERGHCSNNESQVLSTYYALTALNRLDALNATETEQTRRWLMTKWANESVFEKRSKITTAHKTVASLTTLGVDLRTLDGYERRVSIMESRRATFRQRVNEGSIALLELQAYYRTLRLLDGNVGRLDGAIADYLRRTRFDDGGFNYIGGRYSDAKGTAVGVSLLETTGANVTASVEDGTMRTLLRIQSLEGGGFAPNFRPRPTVENTYFAVQSMSALGDYSAHAGTRQFVERAIREVRQSQTGDISHIYRLVVLSRATNASGFTDTEIGRALDVFFERNDTSLREIHSAVRLAAMVNYSVDRNEVIADVRSRRNADGGFGPVSRSDTTYYAVGTLDYLDASIQNRTATVEWVRSNRVASEGYRFQNGNRTASIPDLYGTYLGVRTLRHLGERPDDPAELRAWVASLESPNGGFRPYSNTSTSPKLRYTYWGASTISAIQADESVSSG